LSIILQSDTMMGNQLNLAIKW